MPAMSRFAFRGLVLITMDTRLVGPLFPLRIHLEAEQREIGGCDAPFPAHRVSRHSHLTRLI